MNDTPEAQAAITVFERIGGGAAVGRPEHGIGEAGPHAAQPPLLVPGGDVGSMRCCNAIKGRQCSCSVGSGFVTALI